MDLFVGVIEVFCALPTWANVVLNTSATHYGSELVYTCDTEANQMFPDHRSSHVATCEVDSLWHPDIVSCIGKGQRIIDPFLQ